MGKSCEICVYREGEHAAIGTIFSRAVHEIACEYYTEKQCLAWAPLEPDLEYWKRRCELKKPFVAMMGDKVAGFLELDPDGHIDCAYVNPDFQRRGIMTQLVRHAIQVCDSLNLSRVYVEASLAAKNFFEHLGFEILGENVVERRGSKLLNYRMELRIEGEARDESVVLCGS